LQRRLEQARGLLRTRLGRRGLALSTGVVALLSENLPARATVPLAVVESTIKAALQVKAGQLALGMASVEVVVLVRKVVRTMFWTKVKTAVALLMFLSAAGTGMVFLAGRASGWQDR